MGTNVDVLFDREDRVYRAGDVVKGRVIVESDEEKNLRLIKGKPFLFSLIRILRVKMPRIFRALCS